MKNFKLSENLGNIAVKSILHSVFILPINADDEDVKYWAFPDVMCTVQKDEIAKCIEILTPEEAYWLYLYMTDYMRYYALSDEPMCDRVSELYEVFVKTGVRLGNFIWFYETMRCKGYLKIGGDE